MQLELEELRGIVDRLKANPDRDSQRLAMILLFVSGAAKHSDEHLEYMFRVVGEAGETLYKDLLASRN